jgi:hypothetical protein
VLLQPVSYITRALPTKTQDESQDHLSVDVLLELDLALTASSRTV